MSESQIALGKRIQALRQRSGVTQEQLAERANLSLKHLGEMERGRGNPTLSSLESLAGALGLSLMDLFDFEHQRLSREQVKIELDTLLRDITDEQRTMFYRIVKALLR